MCGHRALLLALDHVMDQGLECISDRRLFKVHEEFNGFVTTALHGLFGVSDATTRVDEVHHLGHFFRVPMIFLDGAYDLPAL